MSHPTSDIDLFTDKCLTNPYPTYSRLRELGGLVWLERHNLWAAPRFETVVAILRDHQSFSSSTGVGLVAQPVTKFPTTLASDEPLHRKLRGLVADQLMPASIASLEAKIDRLAEITVKSLVKKGTFDAVRELAHVLPLKVVTELVGVPESLGADLLRYSDARGDSFGPPDLPRTQAAIAELAKSRKVVDFVAKRENLRPGSMGWSLFEAATRGDIEPEHVPVLMRDYLGPSLETTISGTGNMIWLLASNPDQWDQLVSDPRLVGAAIDESLRLESPIQYFCRAPLTDIEFEGQKIRAGERILVMYASANRDERKWRNADSMDLRRDGLTSQLSFGFGIHSCAGRVLAKSEMGAVLRMLVQHASSLSVVKPVRKLNNLFRNFQELQIHAKPSLQSHGM